MPYTAPIHRSPRPRLLAAAVLAGVFALCLRWPALGQSPVGALDRAPAPLLAVGDVTATSALLWVQGDRAGTLLVELVAAKGGNGPPRRFQRVVGEETDFTAKILVSDLEPGTLHRWRASMVAAAAADGEPRQDAPASPESAGEVLGATAVGSFRTAPDPYAAAPVALVWGGDLGGQNVCRDAQWGFEVFDAIADRKPELFVGVGDMIYADGLCEAIGRYGNTQIPASFGKAADLRGFRAHWRYSRADPGLRRLLAETAYFPVWDDHEVLNDFGPLHDTRTEPPYRDGEHLLPLGLAAMLEQNPIAEHKRTPQRLYRSVRWGQHLELLLLDTRQYRDANAAPDTAQRPKTMLGREQLTWLKDRLAKSDATWVVVASSVPLSIPTGSAEQGGDGWTDFDGKGGFQRELGGILAHAAANGRDRLLFISADVHYAAGFRYRPFADKPGFVPHELITAPLSASIAGGREPDSELGAERLFLHAPDSAEALRDYAQARQWLGFGELRIDADGELTATLRNIDGDPLYGLRLTPLSPVRVAAR